MMQAGMHTAVQCTKTYQAMRKAIEDAAVGLKQLEQPDAPGSTLLSSVAPLHRPSSLMPLNGTQSIILAGTGEGQ